MGLTPGTRLGPYDITGVIGAGGMGEVYRATDARLNRVVALKALHSLSAGDPERVGRFTREAQLLASLNHPNIAAIHGLEEASGEKYLVLEFVAGRTLSDVLASGAVPVHEAIASARQIADALAAAHERGIIHRDVKPGNIMVTAEGVIKVLDFGLGKALESGSRTDSANSPTMTLAATRAGLILGTAGYMSPEQAKGRDADKRSDVWAFGCVLYEMLTGKRAFDGEDLTETLASIVRGEPDWKALPADVPASVRELVEQCLVKNRSERLSDMSVVRYLLSDRPRGPIPAAVASTHSTRSFGWPVVAGLLGLAVLVTAGAMRFTSRDGISPASSNGVTRLSIALPDGDQLFAVNVAPVAISPDGSRIVYVGIRDGNSQLFVRSLSASEPKALAGTEGGTSPFFSPDGRWVGFFAQRKIKKIAPGGAGLQTVTDARDPRGGSWGTDDNIYFAPSNTSGIWRAPASGGTATELTHPDAAQGEISHMWPQVQPGHQTMLFTVRRGPGTDEHAIVSQSLLNGERHTLIPGADMPRSVRSGHLVYARFDTLFAVPWMSPQRDLAGAVPITLAEFPRLENEGAAAYAVSDNGTLAYVAGGPSRTRNRVVWVDRTGKTDALPLPEKEYEAVAISPDGRQAVIQIAEGTTTLWTLDLERGTTTPFLVSGGSSQAPVWTADGKHILYRATRNGFRNLYWKSADGTGAEAALTHKGDVVHTPSSVSPDGKWVLFTETGLDGGIFALRLDAAAGSGAPAPQRVLPAGESGANGQFSPDGRWMAYRSEVSGRSEVYVRPFPGPGPRTQISTMGADQPRWSRDGRELYFSALNGRILAANMSIGSAFTAGVPRVVLEGPYKEQTNANTAFDVARSGRFLFVQAGQTQSPPPRIEIVLNWFNTLRGDAPAK
jgi:eukaryotic-like serine/threonine-protein kinase